MGLFEMSVRFALFIVVTSSLVSCAPVVAKTGSTLGDVAGEGEGEGEGVSFAGTYDGWMVIDIGWPSGGGDVWWDELCGNDAAWNIDDDGTVFGELSCTVDGGGGGGGGGGGRDTVAEVRVDAEVDENGHIDGVMNLSMERFDVRGSISGEADGDEVIMYGDTVIAMGRDDAEVIISFDGTRN